MSKFYTVQEFASLLNVSVSAVERWIADGKIAYWQIETSYALRIPASEIDRFFHPRQK